MNLENVESKAPGCPAWSGKSEADVLGLAPSPDMILESISDLVEIVDQKGVIIYSNLRPRYKKLLGVDRVQGGRCREIYKGFCFSCGDCPMDQVFVTGKPLTSESRIIFKQGGSAWVRQRLYPILNHKGWITAVLRIAFDITGEKRKEMAESKYLDSLEQSLHNRIQGATHMMTQDLSAREMEILPLMADGMSNREIGRVLGISAHTVKTHVVHILNKLNAKDRTQAAVTATRLKLI
jgi:DNA-binding CsgD family transcriptional regulator